MAQKKRKPGMTKEEYDQLYDTLYSYKERGAITDNELSLFVEFLDEMNKDGTAIDTAGKVLLGAVRSLWEVGKNTPDAIKAAKEQLQEQNKPADLGTRIADKATDEIENKLKKVYGQAAKELKDTLGALEKEYDAKVKQKQKDLQDGKITQEEYNSWVRNHLMRQQQVKQQIDQCTGTLLHANEKAIGIVNQEQLTVFAENANFQEYQIDKATGLNLMFTVYDEHSVERMIRDNPDLLPPKKVNEKKDKAWNQTRITAAVTQAIIQGESIPKLAKRIAAESAGGNAASMMRYARTAMTAAQNGGRQEMLQKATGMGIKCKKCWLATLDSRTRDSHADLDGEVVDINEKFSNGLLFPGDPNGNPGEVYNCRCTMAYEYEGYESPAAERLNNETGEMIPDMTYREWKQMNTPAAEVKQEEKREKKAAKLAVDKLSQETKDTIELYTMGEEFRLDQDQLDEITEAMEETTETLYRVETADRTATDYDLNVGDEFNFSQQIFESKDPEGGALRSFTRSKDALPDLADQVDDAIIYRTKGPVQQLPVDSLSQYDQAESLAYGNGWRVTGRSTIKIDGKEYQVIDIEQIRTAAKATADYDAIMKKVEAMEDKRDIWDEGKKNLVPLADEKLSKQAHEIWTNLSDKRLENLTQLTTIDISKLRTEQAEVFTDRLEDLAEAFNGRKVSGARTDDFEGITVAKWRDEYIILDGNNRTNLAILKGQKQLDVMLVDFDDDTELKKLVEKEAERHPVNGKDITGTWQRRPDEFAFEIEDVINAQGFDGLPRIMDADDFDKAVKESGFIAQRVYSAPDQETLDLYQDMLYNGKWYVDCSTGGSHQGQGMYCSSSYDGEITEGIKADMKYYMDNNDARLTTAPFELLSGEEAYVKMPEYLQKIAPDLTTRQKSELTTWLRYELLGEEEDDPEEARRALEKEGIDVDKYGKKLFDFRERAPAIIETLTLTPDAKTINYSEALEKMGKTDRWNDSKNDVGVWAAKHGYDAIRVDWGSKNGSSYTVILNRTKCIFKRSSK